MSGEYIEMISNLIKEALNGPVILSEKKEPAEAPTVTYEPIVLDINWLNDYEESTAPASRTRLRKAAQRAGGGNINNLESFIVGLNSLLGSSTLTDAQKDSHVDTIAKIEIIRTLYNLLGESDKGGAGNVKGYLFEVFMQEVFGGKVETDTAENIADITFDGEDVSLKFIGKGERVEGSTSLLKNRFEESKLGTIRYIVGEKDLKNKTVEFYEFDLTRAYFEKVASTKRFKLTKGSDNITVVPIGVLDFSNAESITQQMFKALDERFRELFSQLQQLNAAANVLRTDVETQKRGRGSAQATAKGRVTRKAGDVRKASQEA
jgi:hypothetical protein